MTYYITRFSSVEMNSGTQLFLRTDSLDLWLTEIAKLLKKKVTYKNRCLYYKQTRSDGSEHTFFTFFDNEYARRNHANLPFVKNPDFIFEGVPEGVKYVKV